MVDPNNGRILSMVNQKLALTSGFTPCSTIKPVIALAALHEGIITPSAKLYVGGKARINLTDALAHSNNAYFHKLGETPVSNVSPSTRVSSAWGRRLDSIYRE